MTWSWHIVGINTIKCCLQLNNLFAWILARKQSWCQNKWNVEKYPECLVSEWKMLFSQMNVKLNYFQVWNNMWDDLPIHDFIKKYAAKTVKHSVTITVEGVGQNGKIIIILCNGNGNLKEYQYILNEGIHQIDENLHIFNRMVGAIILVRNYFKEKWPCTFWKLAKTVSWLEYYRKLLKCNKEESKRWMSRDYWSALQDHEDPVDKYWLCLYFYIPHYRKEGCRF